MFRTLVAKELKAILLSPRFAGTFAVCSLLLLLSAWIGVREYRNAVRAHGIATAMAEQQLREATSWARLSAPVFRAPDPLQIFVAGTAYDVGRVAEVSAQAPPDVSRSAYEDDPLFALFRVFDPALVVLVVLSLLAILFTYDLVCGEKERGTLRLALANAVPRDRFLAAKFAGAWLGLVVPLAIPLALCLLLVLVAGVPLDGARWARLAVLLGGALLYVSFWVAAGLLVSTLARRPGQAFLAALAVWMGLVFVVPRGAVLLATQLSPVPSPAEAAGRRDAFARERMDRLRGEVMAETQRAGAGGAATPDLFRRLHGQAEADIEQYGLRLQEDLRARLAAQQRLAFGLARLSPAAAFHLAAMRLAGTDVDLKTRFEDDLARYRQAFAEFVGRKQQQSGDDGRIMITAGTEGVQVRAPVRAASLDLTELPRFAPSPRGAAETAVPTAVDLGLLTVAALILFGAAHARFRRYDPR